MRKVMVSKRLYRGGAIGWEVTELGVAVFHQFGCDFEEFETGPAPFSTAIVEFHDGRVEMVRPECIRFLAEDTKEAQP